MVVERITPRKYLFLDTNVYLHAQPFHQIPWPQVVESDEVVIVVCAVTIKEMDLKKHDGRTKRIRSRAQQTAVQLMQLLEGDGVVGVGITVQEYLKPPAVDFEAVDLDEREADDRLLATILRYREEKPENPPTLVTSDAGPRLKARGFAIPVIGVPSKYMLEPELSDLERDLRQAKTELARAQASQPVLSIGFPGGLNRVLVHLERELEEAEIENAIANHRRRYSIADRDAEALLGGLMGILAASPQEVSRYKKQLPQFLEKWQKWYRNKVAHEALQARIVKVALEVENRGRKPATDLTVELRFPEDALVSVERPASDPAPEPKPPVKPRSAAELLSQQAAFSGLGGGGFPSSFASLSDSLAIPEMPDLWAPEIQHDTNCVRALLRERKVQQNAGPEALRHVYVIPATDESFQIHYRMTCDELHEAIEGTLHVVYERDT